MGPSLAVSLSKIRLDQLQEAIRSNKVSFPSQVPVFIKHAAGNQQCHVVILYFVRGWSCERIAKRYNVTRQHVWQMVSEWRRHAVALGYLQAIPPPEALRVPEALRPIVRRTPEPVVRNVVPLPVQAEPKPALALA